MKRFARVLATDPAGRIVMVIHRDSGDWNLPGGKVEDGEAPLAAAIRELAEETNIHVTDARLIHEGSYHFGDDLWFGSFYRAEIGHQVPANGEPRKLRAVGLYDESTIRVRTKGRYVLDALDAATSWNDSMISLTRTQHYDPLKQEVLTEIARYLARFPGESLQRLMAQTSRPGDLFARVNMEGHVTTSALVLDRTYQNVLLINHKAQKRWLQPGGHYEAPGSLLDSAMREVAEETGVSDLILHPALSGPTVPLDIDTHPIGARPEKGEGDHFHHDFIYLLVAESEADLLPQIEEVSGARWLPIAEIASLGSTRFDRMAEKLKAIL